MWAAAMAAGISNEVYWSLTVREVKAVLKSIAEQNKQADLRAGLVAATIANVHRRKGSRLVQPQDFLRQPKRFMELDEAVRHMDRWARSVNKEVVQKVLPPPQEEVEPSG